MPRRNIAGGPQHESSAENNSNDANPRDGGGLLHAEKDLQHELAVDEVELRLLVRDLDRVQDFRRVETGRCAGSKHLVFFSKASNCLAVTRQVRLLFRNASSGGHAPGSDVSAAKGI